MPLPRIVTVGLALGSEWKYIGRNCFMYCPSRIGGFEQRNGGSHSKGE